MCVCKSAWAKEWVSSSLSNSSSNRFSPSNDSDNVCTPHQSSLNWFGLLRNSIFLAFCLFFFRYLNPWPPQSLFLSIFFSVSCCHWEMGLRKWFLSFSTCLNLSIALIFCKAALLPSRRKEKETSERKEEKERGRESWGGGELGGLSVVGLRYVCKGLKSVEISRKMPSVAVRGFTPLVVLVQVKRVLRLHKTGQIQLQCQCCGTTMQSAISGP